MNDLCEELSEIILENAKNKKKNLELEKILTHLKKINIKRIMDFNSENDKIEEIKIDLLKIEGEFDKKNEKNENIVNCLNNKQNKCEKKKIELIEINSKKVLPKKINQKNERETQLLIMRNSMDKKLLNLRKNEEDLIKEIEIKKEKIKIEKSEFKKELELSSLEKEKTENLMIYFQEKITKNNKFQAIIFFVGICLGIGFKNIF